jgi:hypothetical protein
MEISDGLPLDEHSGRYGVVTGGQRTNRDAGPKFNQLEDDPLSLARVDDDRRADHRRILPSEHSHACGRMRSRQ